jgi:hypothetical protein
MALNGIPQLETLTDATASAVQGACVSGISVSMVCRWILAFLIGLVLVVLSEAEFLVELAEVGPTLRQALNGKNRRGLRVEKNVC